MMQILAMERVADVLLIKLFITRPKDGKEVTSPAATVQMCVFCKSSNSAKLSDDISSRFPGRPDIAPMIEKEAVTQISCMGVSVCEPGGFSNDVRAALRQQKARNVEFVEEAFTW
jgi:hypothetical protein